MQGGPFLEMSFIIKEPIKIERVISKLKNADVKIEVHNPLEYLQQYYEGYLYDEDDPHSVMIDQITLNLTVHTIRLRRALLFVEKISSDLIIIFDLFLRSCRRCPRMESAWYKR